MSQAELEKRAAVVEFLSSDVSLAVDLLLWPFLFRRCTIAGARLYKGKQIYCSAACEYCSTHAQAHEDS